MQDDNDENSILFFQDLAELDLNIDSAGQKSGLPLVLNSPSNTNQESGYSPDTNALPVPVNRVIYRDIPMSGSKELMMLTTPSLKHNKNNQDVSPPNETPQSPAGNREDQYKAQDDSKSAESDERNISKKIRTLCHQLNKVKARKVLNPLLLILALVNLGLLIALVISQKGKTDAKFRPVTSALSYIGSSLKSHPILDIKLQDGDSCPQDYESFVLGVWPGTVQGCDCPSGLKTGPCRKNARSPPPDPSCDDYAARNPIKLYEWDGSKWCVLRAKHGSQYVKKANCPKDFHKCSSGICVLNTLGCPVTKIKMEKDAILIERGTGESPVIGFTITPNDIPCFSGAYFAKGPVDPYPLIDENENGCGKYGPDDQYSFQVDSQKQSELFSENDFPKKVMNLPRYEKVYKRTDSILSYRRRLSVTETDFCLNVDTEILKKSSEPFDKLKDNLPDSSRIALGFNSFLVGFVTLTILRAWCEAESFKEALTGEISGFWLFFYAFIILIEEAILITMLVEITRSRARMRETQEYLGELAKMGCFLDQQAQSAVNDFHNLIEIETGTPFKYCLSVFLMASFSWICSTLLFWKNRKGFDRIPIGHSQGFIR